MTRECILKEGIEAIFEFRNWRLVPGTIHKYRYRYYRVLTMVYNTQRYCVFGLCPSSGFFLNNNEKHNVSETGPVIEVSSF
jgi:hypothetical protein